MEKGLVFDIQHLSVGDGPGIRTTVFLKGCPLRCDWCHNPESQKLLPQLRLNYSECVQCGKCVAACDKGCHICDPTHRFVSDACNFCLCCYDACPVGALEIVGREMSVEQVLAQVGEDIPFYGKNGGMTLSGGEPLMQFPFSVALLKKAKEQGIHTVVETCGYTTEPMERIAPYVDLWLYDIKLLDDALHAQHTGVSNMRILENLAVLDRLGARFVLRCPIIPGVNLHQAHFDGILNLCKQYDGVEAVHLEAYHPLGIGKAQCIGRTQAYQNPNFLKPEELAPYATYLRREGVEVLVL